MLSRTSHESPWWQVAARRGKVDAARESTRPKMKIIRSANDTRRDAATMGTAARGDAFPATATEELSEHRGRESVSPPPRSSSGGGDPHHKQWTLGRPRLRSSCGRTGFKPAASSSRRPAVSPRPAADFKAAKISLPPFATRCLVTL